MHPSPTQGSFSRLRRWWVARCLLLNGVGTAVDYALVLLTVKGLGWPLPLGAALGVSMGATFNFLMNRRFTFAATGGRLGPQAFRYVTGIGALLLVHTGAVWGLVDGAGLPLLLAKPACDAVLLGLGQLLVLRWYVFGGVIAAASPAAAPRADALS